MLSSYNARRENEQVYEFDRMFINEFGSLPTLFAYRGFDTAVIFGNGIFNEQFEPMCGKRYMPLMTPYTFNNNAAEGNTDGVKSNAEWVRINYHRNYTITTE